MTHIEAKGKIYSIALYLRAHPENQPDSECEDRLFDADEIFKWLDETESELREQVRKLREGVEGIAGYGTFLTVEDAYEMKELAKQLLKETE